MAQKKTPKGNGHKGSIYVPMDERTPAPYGATACMRECGGHVVWVGTQVLYHFECDNPKCDWTSKPLRSGGENKPVEPELLRDYRPALVPEMLRRKVSIPRFVPTPPYTGKITPFEKVVTRLLRAGYATTKAWAAKGATPGAKLAQRIAKRDSIVLLRTHHPIKKKKGA